MHISLQAKLYQGETRSLNREVMQNLSQLKCACYGTYAVVSDPVISFGSPVALH